MKYTQILFVLMAPLVGETNVASACVSGVIDRLVITAHSARPTTLSTFSLTWVKLQARVSESESLDLYMPFMTNKQFIPQVGSICKVKFHAETTSGGTTDGPIPTDRKLKIVDQISCDDGTFIMN